MVDVEPSSPWAGVPRGNEMLRPAQAASRLGYTLSGYYKLARRGGAPRPFAIGPGASVVPAAWIDALIDSRMRSAGM